ncbi:MAG: phosphotransferase [Alphaproteobacteria bacterium]|nr:phosphotransferase [Alphaproteobacteria bacterium]
MIARRYLGICLTAVFLSSNISISMEDKQTNAIAELMHVKPDQIALQRQGKATKTMQIYSFKLNGKKYIVKFLTNKHKFANMKKEIEMLRTLSELGVGAKLVAVGAENDCYIREYVPGKTLKCKDIQDDKVLIAFAKAVRKLHEYKSKDETMTRNLLQRTEKYVNKIAKYKIATPPEFNKAYSKFKKMFKSLKVTKGFCHNYLNPRSVLLTADGNIYFIKFNHCGCSNVIEELGYLTFSGNIVGDKLKKFLEEYYGRHPKKEEIEQIELAQKLVCFSISAQCFASSETKNDYKKDIKAKQKALAEIEKTTDKELLQEYIKQGKIISRYSRNKDFVKKYAIACYKTFLSAMS